MLKKKQLKKNKMKMNNNKEIIFTERLKLRKLRKDDAEPMFRNWGSDPEVAKYSTWIAHENVEVTKKLIDMWLEEEKDGKIVRFVITLKDNDEPIGSIDTANFHDGLPEIGYCLSRKHWGKGYMTEACKAFVEYLFELGYPKILIRADVKNIGSLKVIEKCGFTFTHREHLEHRSSVRPESLDVDWYELKKS